MQILIDQTIPDEYFATIYAGFKEMAGEKEDDAMTDVEHIVAYMKMQFKDVVKAGLVKLAQQNAAASVVLPEF